MVKKKLNKILEGGLGSFIKIDFFVSFAWDSDPKKNDGNHACEN